MTRWLALAFLPLLAAAPVEQQMAQQPQAPADPTADVPSLAEQLAFGNNGPRMTVPVQIAGAGPYEFIIDTGAQRTVISRELAGRLGLAGGRNVRLTGMTGTADVTTVVIPSISVGTLGGERIEAPALDAAHLGASGMLGIDALQGHALAIDFTRQQMTVTPARKRGTRLRSTPDEIVIQARSLFGQLVVTDAKVMGRRVRVVLDTGTSVSMGNLALKRLVTRRKAGLPQALFTSVLGGDVAADYANVPEMKIGSATINNLPIAFADAAPFRAFGLEDKPAVLLGMDALKLFRQVRIDFANRELRLLLPRNVARPEIVRVGV